MTKQKALLFIASGALGFLLHALKIPMPYMLGGIICAFVAKTFIDKETTWPAEWRNIMMTVAGYEIGRSCSYDTLIELSQQVIGVISATGSIIIVSIILAYQLFRLLFINFASPFMINWYFKEKE